MTKRPQTSGSFWVDVLYTDADSEQETWAKVFVVGRESGDWVIHQIHYHRGEEASPFASVEFR